MQAKHCHPYGSSKKVIFHHSYANYFILQLLQNLGMRIVFGTAFDHSYFPYPEQAQGGVFYLGPKSAIRLLERWLGLAGHRDDNAYLRIEQMRQLLAELLVSTKENLFFSASFHANQLATAADLLERRDELLAAGWNFELTDNLPERLSCLAEIENRIQKAALAPAWTDRIEAIIETLPQYRIPIESVQLAEPRQYLTPHWRRLINALENHGIQILQALPYPQPASTDLGRFQHLLRSTSDPLRGRPAADGSLLILKARQDTALAHHLAGLFQRNTDYRPLVLAAQASSILENILQTTGQPCLGLGMASLARPTLQVLKLAPTFLWQPVDPAKLLEFLSLTVKPFDDRLANRLANVVANRPGLFSDQWYATIHNFFERLEADAVRNPNLQPEKVRSTYQFWFERRRYEPRQGVPTFEAIDIYDYLHRWADRLAGDQDGAPSSLRILANQALRVKEILLALPEDRLERLELERIIQTVYEPGPLNRMQRQAEALPTVLESHALYDNVSDTLWWGFVDGESDYFFSKWYRKELNYLSERGVHLESPKKENTRRLWQRRQAFLRTRDRMVLAIPETIAGTSTTAHPLLGDLTALFEDLDPITFRLDEAADRARLNDFFQLPDWREVPLNPASAPNPFLPLPIANSTARQQESITSLEALFFYPHQWYFRHKMRWQQSPILSIVPQYTMLGNLAHTLFEDILTQDLNAWTKKGLETWIDEHAPELLMKEGAVLLQYGQEPLRISFVEKIKSAAWSLIHLIRKNGWTVLGTEVEAQQQFDDIAVMGRADLLLARGEERCVIDLKWKGRRRRRELIRNEEDLQLVFYAWLFQHEHQWAHSAYYIMDACELIARNEKAFQGINPVSPELDQQEVYDRIFKKMLATYRWRMEQLARGELEIRSSHTHSDLEAFYQETLLDVLEMKKEDARFDDYRMLILPIT